MDPLQRLAAVESEVKKLREELAALRTDFTKLQTAPQTAAATVRPPGNFAIKVPIDEDEWIFVTDPATGNPITYQTQEEAEKAGSAWGMHRVQKVK
jgi:hypothetical protein